MPYMYMYLLACFFIVVIVIYPHALVQRTNDWCDIGSGSRCSLHRPYYLEPEAPQSEWHTRLARNGIRVYLTNIIIGMSNWEHSL